ncbi:hypothetical protein C8J57DRAFT_1437777 [Mycena rebaudengoi]|nr:hypothetical protein C8J57DRAFT_1437777 [Mycena rebaudengoi]
MSGSGSTSPNPSTNSITASMTTPKTPLMPKISSPLNPSRPPSLPLPGSPPALPVAPTGRPRGHSLSKLGPQPHSRSPSASPLRSSGSSQRTASGADSIPRMEVSSPSGELAPESPGSTSRSRSKSPTYDRVIASAVLETQTTPPNAPPSTWWGRSLHRDRPWRDPESPDLSPPPSPRLGPKKLTHSPREPSKSSSDARGKEKVVEDDDGDEHIPKEHTEGWERTRESVSQAVGKILPVALVITHDLLEIGTDALRYAPIPGLETAAQLLLTIWDNVQAVDLNRMACLRLAERCANLLLSVLEEVHEAGDRVEEEMEKPLHKLTETFVEVRDFLIKLAHRPFLKRYIKRDDILRDIAGCDTSLSDAMSMFSLSVQMRILKQVKESEDRQKAETAAMLEALQRVQAHSVPPNALGITVDQGQLTPRQGPTGLPNEDEDEHTVLPQLRMIHEKQNTLDFAHDSADLRALMREALAQSSDVEMLRVLQVGRPEMPEALKTLQRALERVCVVTPPPSFVPVSVEHIPPPPPGYTPRSGPEPALMLARSGTASSSESSSASSALALAMGRDTLDREFIEGGIDALRRMSKGGTMLPSWTITRYEVDRDVKIGIGFFSDVYKGTWRGRTVAIKVLAEVTPRDLFLREVNIWKELKHPNVLELYGASGASGNGPWFFVCPYERFGSLSTEEWQEGDLPRFMHEVAKGMEYLHEKGVLHGDLKAANVLVDDRIHCLSEMKSEAYRISGNAPPHGTLRWQAPELMLGSSELTPEMDVYSYAICCIEILSMGRLPWPLMSDEAVRNFVLKDNTRPKIPSTRFSSSALQELLGLCWDRDPTIRPPETKQLRRAADHPFGGFDDPSSPASPRNPDWRELDETRTRPSPDMHPVPLPRTPRKFAVVHSIFMSLTSSIAIPVPSFPFPQPSVSPAASSGDSFHTVSQSFLLADYGGYESPMPADDRHAQIRNERRYLTLPLWNPVPVAVGAVGFLDKAKREAANGDSGLPSVYGYGRVSTGSQRQDKRTATQRGIDAITGFLTFRRSGGWAYLVSFVWRQSVSRRYTFPLRAGHKTAYLCTETTMYRYIETLEAPKKWFKANVDTIMQQYGPLHQITKEDLYLVIGTLDAPEYALFAHFNVYSSPKSGQPWGTFTTDTEPEQGGPSYHEPIHGTPDSDCKISIAGGQWDTVLIARLRFKPDVSDPTSQL